MADSTTLPDRLAALVSTLTHQAEVSRDAAAALQPSIDRLAEVHAALPAFDVNEAITPAVVLGMVAEMRLADLRMLQLYRQSDQVSATREVAYLEILQALTERVDALELRIPTPDLLASMAQA